MDECIRTGVSTSEQTLPGRLGLRRRAPMLYRRLMRGCVGIYFASHLTDFELGTSYRLVCILVLPALQVQLLVRDGSPKLYESLWISKTVFQKTRLPTMAQIIKVLDLSEES